MATAGDLIKRSLRLIGAIATGETPSAAEQADALTTLNGLLSSWSTESLIIYEKTREEFDLVASQSSYTMGSSGDFDTTKPVALLKVLLQQGTLELPIRILTLDERASLAVKGTESNIPHTVYAVWSHPLLTLKFYPVPSVTHKVVIYSEKEITALAGASTDVVLPAGYDDALTYNLALRLAPEYGRQTPGEIIELATETKANIKRRNIGMHYLQADPGSFSGGSRSFNWETGE